MALTPKPQWADLQEPRLPCEVIDWRVGEKLAVLASWTDARTTAIANSAALQREAARAKCRDNAIDEAMVIYSVLDRALTRYVQHGTAAGLAK